MKSYDQNWIQANRDIIFAQAKQRYINPELCFYKAKLAVANSPEGEDLGTGFVYWALGEFDRTYGILGINVSLKSKIRIYLMTNGSGLIITDSPTPELGW